LDEISAGDLARLREHLADRLVESRLGGVFWLELPGGQLTAEQAAHAESCGPHRLALVVEGDSLRLELLVRASQSLRCACTGYADPAQRAWCLEYLDRLVEETGIRT
jgi:hypothetical protein